MPVIPFIGQMVVAIVVIFVIYQRFYDPLKHIPKATVCNLSPCCMSNTTTDNIAEDLNYATRVRNFLRKPRGPDLLGYALRTPNDGILRHSGMLGGQRILVTSPDDMREILQEKR